MSQVRAGVVTTSHRSAPHHLIAAALIGGLAFLIGALTIVQSPGATLRASAAMVIGSSILAWLLGQAVHVVDLRPRMAEPAAAVPTTLDDRAEELASRDSVLPEQVKNALQNLGSPGALAHSPLCRMAVLADAHDTADLRALLVDVISELAVSPKPRDREAGRLLLDYYVKGVGSHEVVMERLHLSRPTFYRRLQRGFELVAAQLDGLNGFVAVVWPSDMAKQQLPNGAGVKPLRIRQAGI